MKYNIHIILITIFSSCSNSPENNSRLDSDNYTRAEERIKILKAQVNCHSDITDAEFELFSVNGFTDQQTPRVPGASSMNYLYAVKVSAGNINDWTRGYRQIDTIVPTDWMKKIVSQRGEVWKAESQPEYYMRDSNDIIVVHRKEGMIFRKVIHD